MAKDDKVELSPDWYTLQVEANGECVFKEEPPPPVGTTAKKDTSNDEDTRTSQAPKESVTPTEHAMEIVKPKPVKRKASSRPRPLKTSLSPSSSESSRSSSSSWPPRRPSALARKKTEPDIVEISDCDTATGKSTVSETRATTTRRLRAGQTPRHSPALPRTTVVDRSLPFGEVAFSGRGWERISHTGATAAVVTPDITTSGGSTLTVEATRILKALEDE